jgi:serine/threonine protein kinase
VLVFQDESKNFFARVADFGYSTRFCGEHDLVRMPKSSPWNAPEHHHREFLVSKAKKMDVYSFGVLCLWLLFERNSIPSSYTRDIQKSERRPSFKNVLESRAGDESFSGLSFDLLSEDKHFDDDIKTRLGMFFACTLASDPNQRSDDFDSMLHLLAPDREMPQLKVIDSESPPERETFQV